MRWYVNDVSLQGQFEDSRAFEDILQRLIAARIANARLKNEFRTMRTLPDRLVGARLTLRQLLQQSRNRDLRSAALVWLDRTGPFVDDDRQQEVDDYFEYLDMDVTESGLGEAARRIRSGEGAMTFSFSGGDVAFETTPLVVEHGLPEERLGSYSVENVWTVDDLTASAMPEGPAIDSWQSLVEFARLRYPRLLIPDDVYLNSKLAREPFDSAIRDRTLILLSYLNAYMAARAQDGSDGPEGRAIVEKYFVGDRALFSGESTTNQRIFQSELTFPDPELPDRNIFAHWHGKISRRFFRLHFQWPAPATSEKLKVVYLGPKLTKD